MSKKIISIMAVMVMVAASIFCTTSVSAIAYGIDLKGETETEAGKTITLVVEMWIANDVYEPDENFVGLGETFRHVVDNSECRWSSSSEEVATVDENGNVTGISEGSATITVIYNDFGRENEAGLDITVKGTAQSDEPSTDEPSSDEPANGILSIGLKGEKEVEVGKTITMTVEAYSAVEGMQEIARVEQLENSGCRWSSSSEKVATVDENGNVTGVSEGTATITAVYNESGKDHSAEFEIIVKAAVQSVEPANDEPAAAEPSTGKPAAPISTPATGSDDAAAFAAVVMLLAGAAAAATYTSRKKQR